MIKFGKVFVLAMVFTVACFCSVWAQIQPRSAGASSNSGSSVPAAEVVAPAASAPAPVAVPVAVAPVNVQVVESKPAILLKINNIKVIKDEDGLSKSCDFDTVIYNRTNDVVSGATVDLSWVDATIEGIIKEEQKQKDKADALEARDAAKAENGKKATARTSRKARTPQTADTEQAETLMFTLEVPEIKPYSQAVITSTLKSDKCFLLIADANLSVKTCNATASETSSNNPVIRRAGGNGGGGCAGIFEFISSKDPQYYRDFKKIDPEAERLARLSRQEIIKQEVEADYQRAMQAMDAISAELSTIQ